MTDPHPKRTLDRAVKMYQNGARIVDIEQQTGVLRASLYYELKKRKLQPARTSLAREARAAADLDLSETALANTDLLQQLIDARTQLAETQARLDAIRSVLESETTTRRPRAS